MNKYEYKNQLETLQELAHIGLWEFDLTTKTLTWSNEIYNIFEMDNKTFIPTYEDFFKIVHPEDKELLENAPLIAFSSAFFSASAKAFCAFSTASFEVVLSDSSKL